MCSEIYIIKKYFSLELWFYETTSQWKDYFLNTSAMVI